MSGILLSVKHCPQQLDDSDCLAACAAMALDYIGVSTTYDELLRLLNIRWFGTPFFAIRSLEQLGVHVLYQHGTLDELREHLMNSHPPIAFVGTGELPYWNRKTEHAVVVVGLDDYFVYLNDPAVADAPIPVSVGDFGLAWLEHDETYAVLRRRT